MPRFWEEENQVEDDWMCKECDHVSLNVFRTMCSHPKWKYWDKTWGIFEPLGPLRDSVSGILLKAV
jgi:hypothetical protein